MRACALLLFSACGFQGPNATQPLARDAPVQALDALPLGDATTTDTAITDATTTALVLCNSPIEDEPFTDPSPCAPWANPGSMNGTNQQGGGALVQTLSANITNANAFCFGNTLRTFSSGFIAVEVPQVETGAAIYSQLQLLGTTSFVVGMDEGSFIFGKLPGTTFASVTYVPSQMRWWRIRRVGGDLVGEFSGDGTSWTQLGNPQTTPPEQTRIQLTTGNNTGADSGNTTFTRLVVCP